MISRTRFVAVLAVVIIALLVAGCVTPGGDLGHFVAGVTTEVVSIPIRAIAPRSRPTPQPTPARPHPETPTATPTIIERKVYVRVPVKPTATPHLDITFAINAYRDFRYEDCLCSLEQLLQLASEQSPGYIDALIYAGASAWMLGQDQKAAQYFKKAHQLDPGCEIDVEEFTPRIVKLFDSQE
jgi:hypothetical protein